MKNIQTNQYFYRSILEKLKKWIDIKEIFIIKGPRQSGKTTILKILKDWLISEKNVKEKNIIFITFEERDILDKFSLDPKEYIKSFIGNKNNEKLYFFIDEFQYLKNSGQILKMLYDIFENIKFIITGSSSLELTDKTDKFLVGRVFSFYLWQLNFEEFVKIKSEQLYNVYKEKTTHINNFIIHNKNFSFAKKDIFESDFEKLFQEYIIYGGYPEVVKSYDRETKKVILKNIYNTYITKDIIELLKITDYSKFKAECETILLRHDAPDFIPVILRPATVCGYSRRHRLDLVVNILTNLAYHTGIIKVLGGNQKRPNIHIKDMVRAYAHILEMPDHLVRKKIYNVGYENHTVSQLANMIGEIVSPLRKVELLREETDDNRSYHVCSDKIANELNFHPKYTIQESVQDLVSAFQNKRLIDPLNNIEYFNIKMMKSRQLQ